MTTTTKKKPTKLAPLPHSRRRALQVLCRDFSRTGRILTGKQVTCKMVTAGAWPGWSIGPDVFVNETTATPMRTQYDYATMKGLQYHELGHVQFTPTPDMMNYIHQARFHSPSLLGTELMRLPPDNPNFPIAWNLLEDQRQETLLIAQFPTMKPYLIMCVLHWVAPEPEDEEAVGEFFLFTRGRRYLPRKVRIMARNKYRAPDDIPTIVRIIDEYRLLDLTDAVDIRRAYHLVNEFAGLLKELPLANGMPHICNVDVVMQGGSHRTDGHGHNAKPQSPKPGVTKKAIDAAKKQEKDAEKKDNPDGASDTPDGDKAKVKDKGKGKPSKSKADSDDSPDEDAKNVLEEAEENQLNIPAVIIEMGQLQNMVRNDAGIGDETPWVADWGNKVPDGSGKIVRATVHELRRIEEDSDPHWRTHQSAGRLNVQRAMHADFSSDDLFDDWNQGHIVGTDMEMFISLDVSPSMRNYCPELSLAAWVIKRATDLLRVTCTIAAYGDTHAIVYGPKDRASLTKYPFLIDNLGGGTQPGSCLVEGHRVLVRSRKSKRLFLVMTDGMWHNPIAAHIGGGKVGFLSCDEVIEDLNRRGVTTVLAHFEAGGTSHGAQVFANFANMRDFPIFVRNQLIKELKK